ncbi:MAG: YfhO family protein, partial [Chloroflexi bacterium]|nr:YfhO family protein [Chloroflexota bacterium]
ALTALLRRDARIWFFFLLALFSLILALGEFTPLYQLLYFVPIFNRFRVPARFLFPFIFSMTFLAAICFDKLINHLRDSTTSSRAAEFIAGIFAILFVVMIGFAPLNVGMWIQVWQILPALFAFLGIIAMILALKRVVRRREFATVIIGLSLLDLTAFAFPFLTTVDTLISPSEFIQAPLSISAMDSTTFLYRMYTNVYNTSLRPNHQLIFDKQSAQAYTPLPLQRNDNYLFRLSPQMLNLLNVRYYLLPNGEVPPEFSEPTASVLLDPLRAEIEIRSTPTARVEIISYSDNTENLADGFLAGELEMKTANESVITFPIRLGIETADWAYASKAEIKHRKLQNVLSFPAFLISINRSFDGFKYVAQYTLPTQTNIISIHARTFLPAGKLIIENISLIDQEDKRSSLAALAHRNDLALVFKSHAVAVMENRDVLPRALVVHSAQVVSDDHALENMRSADFDPRQTVLLAQESALASTNTTPSDLTDKIEIVKYESETVAINVTADRAGYLILADTFYPGWEAYVDGQRTPIYRADYIFRAVPIRTGSHTIIFEFHPASFVIGAWISAISLILSGVLARIGLKKSWFTVPNAKENS